jgi:hypothetical protein
LNLGFLAMVTSLLVTGMKVTVQTKTVCKRQSILEVIVL